MFFKEIKVFHRGSGEVTENKPETKRLSSEIDTMISCTKARLNLLRGLSELKAQLGIDDESQQLDMPDKET